LFDVLNLIFEKLRLSLFEILKQQFMKTLKLITFIVLMCVFHISNAQNWHLIENAITYHYSCDTTNLIFSLWSDSTKINGNDTTIFTNRVILPCDTCHAENYPNSNANKFMLKNQALFLQREIKISANGKINLQSPDSFIIEKNFAINQTWNFSSAKIANIYFRGISNILGVQDSVIGVLVNLTDTIIISKNYGVVQYPCVAGTYNEIYDFQKDDIISISSSYFSPVDRYEYGTNLIIEDVIYDSIGNYKFKVCGCQYGWLTDGVGYGSLNDTIKDIINPLVNPLIYSDYYDNNIHLISLRTFQDIQNLTPNDVLPKPFLIFKLYLKEGITYFEQEPTIYSELNGYYYPNVNHDIICGFSTNEEYSDEIQHHILVVENIGLIEDFMSGFEFSKGNSSYKAIANSPEATVCDYCILLSKNIEQNQFQIFPNPTTGIINISGLNVDNIEVYNVFGQKVYQKSFTNSENNENLKIDLKNYVSTGIYFVNIQSKNKNFTSKLIVN